MIIFESLIKRTKHREIALNMVLHQIFFLLDKKLSN